MVPFFFLSRDDDGERIWVFYHAKRNISNIGIFQWIIYIYIYVYLYICIYINLQYLIFHCAGIIIKDDYGEFATL